MTVVSPFFTFPNINWWARVMQADVLLLDNGEHFEKMTYRNRYKIAGANNSILLSVPLVNGRNQHVPMADVRIHNAERWQTQHWRTLVSVYRRSPYFEHYEDSLKTLFETEYELLTDFNRASMVWVKKVLKLRFDIQEATTYVKAYPAEMTDIRNVKDAGVTIPKYYQLFEDRIGFLPDLSILDLLFSEGPGALSILDRVVYS